jgi:threonine/homoserine/homoserine lactone efflux protein
MPGVSLQHSPPRSEVCRLRIPKNMHIQLSSQLIPFLGVVGTITLMSGPDTALVVRDVPRHDLRAGLATALGSRVGLIVWGLAAALGIFGLVTLSER